MSARPFMQLYVGDYFQKTRHLSTEEHGAYLLLLMTMWTSGGYLPNDGKKLARVAGLSPAKWRRVWPELEGYFTVVDDRITQERLQKEIKKTEEKSLKLAQNGSKGGKAKALKNNDPDLANATDLLPELPKHSQISEPYIEKEEPKGSKKKPEKKPDHVQVKENLSAVIGEDLAQAVFDHRKKINKPLTPRAAKMLANKFGQCPDPMAAAEAMISNGWQGFEPEWLGRTQATSRNGAYGMADAYLKSEARQPVQTDMLAVENPMTGELEYYPQ